MLGRHHPLLRRVRALRRDAALRRSDGVFLAEGIHLAQEALTCGAEIEVALHSARLLRSPEGPQLRDGLLARGVPCHETSDATLGAACDARSPQPIVCLVRHRAPAGPELTETLERASLVVVVDGVQDPGNLGSILRTADGAGCDACIVGQGSTDPLHPRAVRATMGSVFRLPVWVEPVEGALARLARHGFRICGADPHRGTDYDRADLGGKLAVVLGGEGGGLGTDAERRSDHLLRVPLRPGVESLSVGAAAAVVLFEAARQRRR